MFLRNARVEVLLSHTTPYPDLLGASPGRTRPGDAAGEIARRGSTVTCRLGGLVRIGTVGVKHENHGKP